MGDVTFKAEVTQTSVIGTIPRQLVFNVLQQFEHYSYAIVKLLHSDIESGYSECIMPLLLKRSQFLLSNSEHKTTSFCMNGVCICVTDKKETSETILTLQLKLPSAMQVLKQVTTIIG